MPEVVETTPETVPPENYQDYKTFRETGKLPAAAEPEKPPTEISEGSETETSEPPETASESETDEEKQEQEQSKSKRGIEKRFRELTTQVRELRQQLAAKAESGVASPKSEPESEPQAADFTEYSDYVRALTKHTATQVAREERAAANQFEQQRIAVDAWTAREKAVRAKNADYDEVLSSVDDINFVPAIRDALVGSELGPQIAYHLARNRAEAERIAQLHPIAAVREIGKLEAKLSPSVSEEKKSPKLSAAPEPIRPVNGSTTASTKKPDEMEYQEYKRYREEQLRQSRR